MNTIAGGGVEQSDPARFEALRRTLPAVPGLVVLTVLGEQVQPDGEITLVPLFNWPPDSQASTALRLLAGHCMEQSRRKSIEDADGSRHVARPWVEAGVIRFMLLMSVRQSSEGDTAWIESLFDYCCGLWTRDAVEADGCRHIGAGSPARRDVDPAGQDQLIDPGLVKLLTSLLEVMGATLEEREARLAADRAVIAVAQKLDCPRVSFGLRRGARFRMLALSDTPDIRQASRLVESLSGVMNDAIDQRAPLATIDQAHSLFVRQYLQDYPGRQLLCIPFRHGDRAGAFCFERESPASFGETERERFETLAAYLGRLLVLHEETEAGPWRALSRKLSRSIRFVAAPARRGLQLLMLLALIGLGVLLGEKATLTVPAIAHLEGAAQRAVVAPFDGYVASAAVKAGDSVRAEQLMVRLDDRDFQLERSRAQSLIEQYRSQYQEAIARRDRASAVIAQAQGEQAATQLAFAEDRLRRAAILSPFDAFVVTGDLSQRLGAPVRKGETLFEVARLEGGIAVLMVEDAELGWLSPGQRGRLKLRALPERTFEVTLTRITSMTESREGRTRFRVEAALLDPEPVLRPGMQGQALIDIEQRPLWWVLTHRLLAWLRLSLWGLLP